MMLSSSSSSSSNVLSKSSIVGGCVVVFVGVINAFHLPQALTTTTSHGGVSCWNRNFQHNMYAPNDHYQQQQDISHRNRNRHRFRPSSSSLFVSIGLGPDQQQKEETDNEDDDPYAEWEYEIPNHEEYRTSRRSALDERCDAWFSKLLGNEIEDDDKEKKIMGSLAMEARTVLTTPVPLENEYEKPKDDPEWTPYVATKLPWTPLVPAYGLEEFGLPVPRRNAETWRHFDVTGMISTDYSNLVENVSKSIEWTNQDEVDAIQKQLEAKGSWLEDDACNARLVYINGRFAPQLSKTSDTATNLDSLDSMDDEMKGYLRRLPDGFTDELAASCMNGDEEQTSYKKLSYPDHCIGTATSQFAINTQQGTACFAALNTIHTGAVAFVRSTKVEEEQGADGDDDEDAPPPKPVLIVQAVTPGAGGDKSNDSTEDETGVALHPRTLVVAEDGSKLALVQSAVDLDTIKEEEEESSRPKLYNGYTQIFVKGNANVTHSYLEESGGMVTGGTEIPDDQLDESQLDENGLKPREVESRRPARMDTHLEALDVHVMGEDGSYDAALMCVGGSGRVRVCLSVALLQTGAHASLNGFSLSGGAQRCDIKTNIHHIAQGATSRQIQKNMIGGRAVASFRGRVRVEQSAQQTDSEQLSRSVLLSDKARAWAIPSLEIIADDVTCTHGATVSDLSDEELFYLRSRGLSQTSARNMLMYAFVDEIVQFVDPSMLGRLDSSEGLQRRLLRRLENLVPRGERAVRADFSSV